MDVLRLDDSRTDCDEVYKERSRKTDQGKFSATNVTSGFNFLKWIIEGSYLKL